MKRDSEYRSHRISSNRRKTEGGKGDLDRSDPELYRDGYDRVDWSDTGDTEEEKEDE